MIVLGVGLKQGSPNFFFNGPDDNVDLWSRARFERNILEQLSNFTDLNIERIYEIDKTKRKQQSKI